MTKLLHIAQANDIKQAKTSGRYRCESIESEGFIHCCTPEQLQGVVSRYYSTAQGMMLMHIDSELLEAELVFENTMGGEEQFPHVYGEINMDAVQQIGPLEESI